MGIVNMYLGTIVNTSTVIIGGTLGILLFKNGIQDRFKNILIYGICSALIVLGIMDVVHSISAEEVVNVIIFIVIGGLIGEIIDIEKQLTKFANWLGSKFGKNDEKFSTGFVTAVVIFCAEALPIMGAMESGLLGKNTIFFAKSITDGVAATIFESFLGLGVVFSSGVVFIYQAVLTFIASLMGSMIPEIAVNYIQAVGGTLLITLAISIMEIKEIKVANLIPALFLPIIYYMIF